MIHDGEKEVGADEKYATPNRAASPLEAVLLAIVLIAGFHAIPYWILHFLPARKIYETFGPDRYATFFDGLTLIMPLLLCLGSPIRSGLIWGNWSGRYRLILGIWAVPVVLTAVIYPFTSQPFTGDRIGGWLVSPLAQDLLFSGFLYGLFDSVFVPSNKRWVPNASIATAIFFALWHIPNFAGIQPTYVVFQLVYTFLFGLWFLLVRRQTGSIIPVVLIHMSVNFISWMGW